MRALVEHIHSELDRLVFVHPRGKGLRLAASVHDLDLAFERAVGAKRHAGLESSFTGHTRVDE